MEALFGAIIGATITFLTTLVASIYIKTREIRCAARDSAFQILIILALQKCDLGNFSIFIQNTENNKGNQKCFILENPLSFDNEMIYKLLAYCNNKINQHVQEIIKTQIAYKNIYLLLEKYNKSLSPEILEKLTEKNPQNSSAKNIRDGLQQEIDDYFENIKKSYEDSIKLIDSCLEKFGGTCEDIFTEHADICIRSKNFYNEAIGRLFKPYNFKAPIVQKYENPDN